MRSILMLILSVLLVQSPDTAIGGIEQHFFYTDQDGYHLVNGSELVDLPGIPRGSSVSWTPDGDYLTYVQNTLYQVMDVDTGAVIYTAELDLNTAQTRPIWSSNGRHFVVGDVAFVSTSDYVEHLVLFTVDEAYRVIGSQRIYEGSAFFPEWSPDGTRLAFVDRRAFVDGLSEVQIYDAEKGTLTAHTIDSLDTFRVYWWDNEYIAFVREDGIYRIRLNTDTAALVYPMGIALPATNHWEISPDHTRLVFDHGLYALTENGMERIQDVNVMTAWSPDSQTYLMVISNPGVRCYDNAVRTVCYSISTLDIVLNDRNGNFVAGIAHDVGVVDIGWRP